MRAPRMGWEKRIAENSLVRILSDGANEFFSRPRLDARARREGKGGRGVDEGRQESAAERRSLFRSG